MRYARDVIDLLSAYPGRPFRPGEVTRYVATRQRGMKPEAIRIGVQRVLLALCETGAVNRTLPLRPGSYALYAWHTTSASTVTFSASIQ